MAKTKMKPLGDKIIIKRTEADDRTAGGIYLPENAKEKPKRGVVQAVGSGRVNDSGDRTPLQVKANDEVLFSSYAGTEVKVDGQELLIMSESEVLAVLD